MNRPGRKLWRGSGEPRDVPLHSHRDLAESFGHDAGLYDRARPRYPVALVDHLLRGSVRTVLDVGCGTGLAGSLFSERGREIVGIEPDRRMAQLARRRGLEVEVSLFEEWDPGQRRFDLMISAQAWHWIDPTQGPQKAASALRDGGRAGIFWNVCSPPPAVREEIERSYAALAPDFFRYSVLLNQGENRVDTVADSLQEHGSFSRPEHLTWHWSRCYTTDEWLEHLITHSDHDALPGERRHPLFLAVIRAFERLGGSAEMHFETHLVLATRQPR